ncbi:MAG: hypothetical protein E6772_02905 [Dysgonomonas sp.]|nr:hypothetical protein [Dysgonomonas sp.]
MEQYEATKVCKNCETEFIINLSKNEAAFNALSSEKVKNAECPSCGCKELKSAGICPPLVDSELMLEWMKNDNLYFSQQDEDLLLGEIQYIDLIKQFLMMDNISLSKRNILLSALCVIVYDNEDKKKCKEVIEIRLSQEKYLDNAKNIIFDYIGKKVYPKLGLKW